MALRTGPLLFLIFFILPINNSYAQKDYVITINKDTIFCKIRKNGFNAKMQFNSIKNGKFTDIKPDSITEYFLNDDSLTYRLRALPQNNKNTFVRWLEKGKINLFEWTSVTENSNNREIKYYWFIKKDTQRLIPIKIREELNSDIHKNKEFFMALKNAFADNNDIISSFNYDFHFANPNNDSDIRKYIRLYNKEYKNK